MTDLDAAADELYGLGPAEQDRFAGRRAELAAAAKAAGDRELAAEIAKLKKPVQAAVLANAVVRAEPRALAELGRLAAELRDAHRQLRGSELRELSERRQRLLRRLTELGRTTAGRPVGETVLGQLRATFEAALADPEAHRAVLSGRLTAALSYSGFGEVDLSDAVAAPRRLHAVPDLVETGSAGAALTDLAPGAALADAAPDAAEARAERRKAERALQRAEVAATAAEQALTEAADRLAQAREHEREVAGLLTELQDRLAAARDEATAATRTIAAAEREHERAERAAERAEQARERAESDVRQWDRP